MLPEAATGVGKSDLGIRKTWQSSPKVMRPHYGRAVYELLAGHNWRTQAAVCSMSSEFQPTKTEPLCTASLSHNFHNPRFPDAESIGSRENPPAADPPWCLL